MHESISALVRQEGWRAEGNAARVHYDGGDDRFAVEFYAVVDRVIYWTVPDPNREGPAETARPVPRARIPDPLRRRIRADLEGAGVDPAVERESV